MIWTAATLLFFPALMAFAASSDLLTMRISNGLTLALVAGFFVLAFGLGLPLAEIGVRVGVAACVLVVAFICFARGWIGGGDAKLAAATVLWFNVEQTVDFLLYASLLGGVLTFAIIRFRTMALPHALDGQDWAVRLHRADAGVPYGIALAIAALLVYPETLFMRALGG